MSRRSAQVQELRGTPRLRRDELPPGTLVLLRGAPVELSELVEQVADSGRRYTLDGAPFYALSLTAVIDSVTEDELLALPPLKAYPRYYRMTAGDLYTAAYPVWETFRKATHCDVQLSAPTLDAIATFLAVAGPMHDNRHYEA